MTAIRRWMCAAVLVLLGWHGRSMASNVLQAWEFERADDAKAWGKCNHVSELAVDGGILSGRIMDWDPWITSPAFEIPASPWQAVEIRMKTDCGGSGDIFYTNTNESKYDGFFPKKHTHFDIIGDGKWHEYRVLPFWQAEKKIIKIRLDFAAARGEAAGKRQFWVDWVRITAFTPPGEDSTAPTWDFLNGNLGWEVGDEPASVESGHGIIARGDSPSARTLHSPPMRVSIDDAGFWLSVEMSADKGNRATLSWASTKSNGFASRTFPVTGDGVFRRYNVDMGASSAWDGDLVLLRFTPSDASEADCRVRSIMISDAPQGPAEVDVLYAGLANAINRTGARCPFTLKLSNTGGEDARGLRITDFSLPEGVKPAWSWGWRKVDDVVPFVPATKQIILRSSRPASGPFSLTIEGENGLSVTCNGELSIEAGLGLPEADYVPEPQPVESDYEIGALYFPGWPDIGRWARIWPTAPERKPVLGWYDEANPQCVDWQIKWAVENGLKFFLVDWYWSAGGQHLDHWVQAYKKARYRHYLKWAMMWANHNRPGSHSEEDQRAVTQWWIDNYFNMPGYYRINDMPVVMIWSPRNMDRDFANIGGLKHCLDISQQMAREAGYKGIWFIAMKWPEASTDPKDIQWLADGGFNMTSLYHYMHHGGKAENPKYFPFDLVADSSYTFWQDRKKADILPFLPNLSTGWDSRPWHGDRATVVHSRTAGKFRRICEDARKFADETGIKRMVLGPLNEWGEGSYAEPNKEFGFGMYEAVREVFCKKPAEGWPLNYGPTDVGLGPYDLEMPQQLEETKWQFKNGTEGWAGMMGIGSIRAEDGSLLLTTTHHDPALSKQLAKLRASGFSAVEVKLKLVEAPTDPGTLQLFWSTTTAPVAEATSVKVPLINDGDWHTYVLPVSENKRWRGLLTSFRLDTGNAKGLRIAIDEVRMIKR